MKITTEMYAAAGLCGLALFVSLPDLMSSSGVYETPVKQLTIPAQQAEVAVLPVTTDRPFEGRYVGEFG